MGLYTPRAEANNRTKKYVEVIADHSEEGSIRPLTIVWDTGVRYEIDKVIEARQAHSLRTGGTGIRFTVRINGQTTYLWYEGPRWFVEAKTVAMPY